MDQPKYVKSQGLGKKELTEIRELAAVCEDRDGIRLKLNWDLLQDRPSGETNDFLCYLEGKLVGFAGLYGFGRGEIELSGMVHPDYRLRRIFRSLVEAASEAARSRSIAELIFIVPQNAAAGTAAAASFRAAYSFSEYMMELTEPAASLRTDADLSVRLRDAGPGDLALLERINSQGFGMKPDESRELMRTLSTSPGSGVYSIASHNEQPVGLIRVQKEPGEAFIYGFCVVPDQRGHGIGRSILAQTVQRLKREGTPRVLLEVACENRKALGLYESVGFEIVQGIDYFVAPLA